MKHPAGSARPRRTAAPKVAPKKREKVRLDLKRRPQPEPEEDLDSRQKSHFWKWVALVALLHLLVIGLAYWIYESASAVKPPEPFISLLPPGNTVRGTPGAQESHKVAPNPSLAVHHASAPAPTPTPTVKPKPVTPPKPTPVAVDKPAPVKPPPKPAPKVKVDLTLAEAPAQPTDKPQVKHTPKKPVKPDDSDDDAPAHVSLSKAQIAAKLGEKLDAEGVRNAAKTGASGSANSREDRFGEFYNLIAEQVHEEWNSPNMAGSVQAEPLVGIHVEKDGRVPVESVHLIRSSGDPSYDAAAVETVKRLNYLREPLPAGCPADISINFNPNP